MQKKLLLLGGLKYSIPIIEEAHKLGSYVITADNIPNNIAHKYSDQYINVSIIDKDRVLQEAIDLQIDGILSHAVDPGVITAAYVAEKMKLPYQCTYNTARILQNKYLFRNFLRENHFNCPNAANFTNIEDALSNIHESMLPVIVKPVDSAGSKGVTKVDALEELPNALNQALKYSISNEIIVEEYIENQGYPFGTESFVVNGELRYNGFYDQYFDLDSINPFVPVAEIWPSIVSEEIQNKVKNELQRLFTLLQINTGLFNVECRLGKNNKVYLMEVSPRGGGNRLAEILNYASDVNLIQAETFKALGIPLCDIHEPNYNGHYAIVVLHTLKSGIYDELVIDDDVRSNYLIEEEIRVVRGDSVNNFSAANTSIGTLFMRFKSRKELDHILNTQSDWLKIKLR